MNTLGKRVRERLIAVADPAKAPGMQAYMKSDMPYLGVSAVPLRRVCKDTFAAIGYTSTRHWQRDVLSLWRGACYREERYAAIALTGVRVAEAFHTVEALDMYEEMVVSGAWWDCVDGIATKRLWMILRAEPARMKRILLQWSRDDNFWKRRCAILSQIKAKEGTDLRFLYACIEPSLGSREFFLRKAIGWALREYAWTDPREVRRYVKQNQERLSGLSRREALKNIGI